MLGSQMKIENRLVIRTVTHVATRCGGEWGWLRDGAIPLRFQGGVAAPLIKRSRSSAAQTGWLVNSNKNKVRYADIYKEATRPFSNHPDCAAEERDLFIEAQPPSLKRGMSSLQQLSSISKLLALGTHQKSDVYVTDNWLPAGIPHCVGPRKTGRARRKPSRYRPCPRLRRSSAGLGVC